MRPIALIRACTVAALLGAMGPAQEWTRLDGPALAAALTGRTLDYPGAWQEFRATGRTLYNAGQDSWGYWQVQDDRYCSQWPPNALWECYLVEQRGDQIRFIGDHGDETTGRFRD